MDVDGSDRQHSSFWSVLRYPRFKSLWSAGGVFFVGNAMLNMAISWEMVEVTGSAFLSALVQTASFLPMFLLSLPAGVIADAGNRRVLLARVQGTYGFLALMLTAATLLGAVHPFALLLFAFGLGSCTAFQSPAWNSMMSESIPRKDIPHAITLVSMAFNGARAVGPALAGLIFAFTGSAVVFGFAVVSAINMSRVVRRYPPELRLQGKLPPERLWSGTLTALRYARHSAPVFAQLIRTAIYSGVGSALWALLPVIAQQHLQLGPAGYGWLMACLGSGAVCAGLFVGRVRATMSLDRLAMICHGGFTLAMLTCAFSKIHAAVYFSLFFGGASWMAMMSTLNAATLVSVSPWIRARAASMHTLCSLGAFALGSALWGAISALTTVPVALSIAATAMLCSITLFKRFPLIFGTQAEVTAAELDDDFIVHAEPELEAGPVAVEVIYTINGAETEDFLAALRRLAEPRRRDGATFWRIYRDLGNQSRYVERFMVTSWADYLRQRSRATLSMLELESQAKSFQTVGEPVIMRHYLAERSS